MITVCVVAQTQSQFQAWVRRWFPTGPRALDKMHETFIFLSPMDPSNESKIRGLRGGLFFCCERTRPDMVLAELLTRQQFHETRFLRGEDRQ
jgi:hypothetical protein